MFSTRFATRRVLKSCRSFVHSSPLLLSTGGAKRASLGLRAAPASALFNQRKFEAIKGSFIARSSSSSVETSEVHMDASTNPLLTVGFRK